MAGQMNYGFQTPRGIAGSLYDLAPYEIVSRLNGEVTPGVMLFGMGAVIGDVPGVNVMVPETDATAAEFEGVIMTGFTNQMNMAGDVNIYPQQTVGILRWGNAWVRIPDDVAPDYGEDVFLIITGSDAGKFTNDSAAGISINARFIDKPGTGSIAPIQIFNQKNA